MKKKFYPHEKFGDVVQQTIMPICAIADGEIIPLGTGFVVMANGLLMTAKHVIEDFCQPKVMKRDGSGFYREISLYAVYVSDEKDAENNENYFGGLWPILKTSFAAELDVAFCWLAAMYRNDELFMLKAAVKLSPEVPKVGTHILGFGYHKTSALFSKEVIEGGKVIDYKHETAYTEGQIMEIKSREGFRTFPHFRTDARFEPGMSGGPIFNEKGGVCGVICSSMKGFTDEDGYVSYASLIWPALGISTETSFSDDGPVEKVLIYDLAKKGFIKTDASIEKVIIEVGKDGNKKVSIRTN